MTRESRAHDQDHDDSVTLYALQALPPAEASAVEARLPTCEDCRRQLRTLRHMVDSFTAWPTDVLRPAEPLWDRLARRIGAETGRPPSTLPLSAEDARLPKPEWKVAAPGISCKLLATDPERRRVSMLVRLEPNTAYPSHRHSGVEELHLLDGVLIVDDRTLYPGDYLRSEPGTGDGRVWSETGCTCVLITSSDDVLL
jgi:ChrR-like protein with cupin domain